MRISLCAALALALLLGIGSSYADLHDPANSADYLIVTPASVIQANPWIGQLAAWRTTHGRTAVVVPTDSIYAEFGNGSPSDSTLKDFLFYAYNHWSPPQLRDVFLIGWHDMIPSHVLPNGNLGSYLSDVYFTTDPDSQNSFLPRFNLGRLPWSPMQSPQLYPYLDKITAYENAPPADWQHLVRLIADSTDDFLNFDSLCQSYVAHIHSGYDVARHYLGAPPGHPWRGDSITIMAGMNAGSYLLVSNGHATFGSWGWSIPLDSINVATLSNSPRLPIVHGVERDASMSDPYPISPIPKALLSNMNGGVIAYLAQTGEAYVGQLNVYRQTFFGLATSDSVQTVGDLWRQTAIHYLQSYYLPDPVITGSMLLGDPGLRLPARPQPVTEEPVALPSQIRLVGNYPNPFNPSTQIEFELPRAAHIRLTVMNILGQHIASLVDAPRDAGTHSVTWNAADHPSGLYFAVLESGSVRQVKKMMLLK